MFGKTIKWNKKIFKERKIFPFTLTFNLNSKNFKEDKKTGRRTLSLEASYFEKNRKNLNIFYLITHTPFYVSTLALSSTIMGFHFYPLFQDNSIVISRMLLYFYPFSSALTNSINISHYLSNNEEILLSSNLNNIDEILIAKNNSNKIILFSSAFILNFISGQILLHGNIFSLSLLSYSYAGFFISFLITFYGKIIPKSYSSQNLNISTTGIVNYLNFLFISVLFAYYYYNIKFKKMNPLKKKNDMKRLENLKNKSEIIQNDEERIYAENDEIFSNLSTEQMVDLENFYNKNE
jgi:hypothetical protein